MIVRITPKAQKQLTKLPKSELKKIHKRMILLEKEPFVGKVLSGKLDCFRVFRAWPYRIIYHVESSKNEIWVDSFIHRQGAYK